MFIDIGVEVGIHEVGGPTVGFRQSFGLSLEQGSHAWTYWRVEGLVFFYTGTRSELWYIFFESVE